MTSSDVWKWPPNSQRRQCGQCLVNEGSNNQLRFPMAVLDDEYRDGLQNQALLGATSLEFVIRLLPQNVLTWHHFNPSEKLFLLFACYPGKRGRRGVLGGLKTTAPFSQVLWRD